MADNNKNPRRTIWLSETEPLSHYDIWLSKNQHLNSDREPVSDSGVQRPCDYIFKVWDCDNWYPIVGFNSTALNKINTVYNTNYTTTHDGHSISSSSYQEFHLPLFTKPTSSPSELFDAGTIGEAILEYVTETEWQNIFGGDAFNNSFQQYFENIVNEGDININELLESAEANKLGGIWADEFQITDIFPDSAPIPSQQQIINSYNWIAQAKYKYNHGTSDYNLYVSAKDVIGAINHYQIYNPDAPGINININSLAQELEDIFKNSSSLGFEDVWSVVSDPHVYPHIWGVSPSNAGKFLRINPVWNSEEDGWSQSNNNMDWVDLREIIPDLVKDENIFVPKDGISISYVAPHDDYRQYVEFGLNHIEQATDGQCCIKITNHGDTDIAWVNLPEYEELNSSNTDENLYVVRGLDVSNKQNYLLGGNGKWIKKGYGLSVVQTPDSEYRIDQNIYKQDDVEINNVTGKYIVFEVSSTPLGEEIVNISYNNTGTIVNEYQYKKVTISATPKTLHFKDISNTEYTNPISIKIIASEALDLKFTNTKYIYEGDTSLSALPQGTEWLLTFQFGVVKFEEIITPQ